MHKILVIEDDPRTRANLATILEMEGYEVFTAEHGQIGLEMLGAAENTVKRHLQNIFEKLGVDSRNAAAIRALETLSSTGSRS